MRKGEGKERVTLRSRWMSEGIGYEQKPSSYVIGGMRKNTSLGRLAESTSLARLQKNLFTEAFRVRVHQVGKRSQLFAVEEGNCCGFKGKQPVPFSLERLTH